MEVPVTRPRAALAALAVAGAVLVGCSGTYGSSASSTSSHTTATTADASGQLCSAVDQLKTSITQLQQVQLTQDGLDALRRAMASVGSAVDGVVQARTPQFRPQVDQLQGDADALRSLLQTAGSSPTAVSLESMRTAVTAVVDDASALAHDVASTC
jgi:ABC-type glycerol-3-phosphate transport system substrate-binding protein